MSESEQPRYKEIFLEAVERPPEERAAYLDEACGDDARLRNEVETLLDHHDPKSIVGERAETPAERPPKSRVLRPRRTSSSFTTQRPVTAGRFAWVVLALLGLLALAMWGKSRVERTQLRARGAELQAILDANVAALDRWVGDQKLKARQFVDDPRVLPHVEELVEISAAGEEAVQALRASPAQGALRELWQPRSGFPHVSVGFLNVRGQDINDEAEAAIGMFTSPLSMSHQAPVLAGETVFVRPQRGQDIFRDDALISVESMFCYFGAPVRDEQERVVASFWMVYSASGSFSDILETAQVGRTGETYAFGDRGLMVSRSRFEDQLRDLGLLPPEDQAGPAWERGSQLNLSVRDSGEDLREADLDALNLEVRPLTLLAATAIAARKSADPEARRGVLTEPYRGYRGLEVIGAWRWHEEYDMALATEMDVSEALAPLHHLDAVFMVLYGLLTLFVGATLVSTLSALRLRRRLGRLQQLGQYTLLESLAEGGMGKVYRGEHALLKRPTAIKVLSEELLTADGVARFEREVRLASQLTHPNTIDIYDYGRTPEGVFYYAMELVEGPTLGELVAREGPLPAVRVAHILKQVCLSLGEAHGKGLVHRDVKPANIMLCERGGVSDVVKVLDFGLVKDIEKPHTRELTVPTQVGGTLLYMAPERITAAETVDARSDIYSLGAVGYFLLSGRPVFTAEGDVDLLWKVVNAAPEPLGSPGGVPSELEGLILRCLAKDPEERPRDVCELLDGLDAIPRLKAWPRWGSMRKDAGSTRSPVKENGRDPGGLSRELRVKRRMTLTRDLFGLLAVAPLLLVACTSGPPADQAADTVYTDGKIYTVDEAQPWAEAVAIKDGEFLVVGSNADVEAVSGEASEVVDLGGAFVMPGIVEMHAHPFTGVDLGIGSANLSQPGDLDAVLADVREYVAANPEKDVILGGNWLVGGALDENDSPDKKILDEIAPDLPVFLLSQSGHSAWVNSKALELAGIDESFENTSSYIFDRYPGTNEPSGTVRESGMVLIMNQLHYLAPEEFAPFFEREIERYSRHGVTAIQPAEGYPSAYRGAALLEEQGRLNVRLFPAGDWLTSQLRVLDDEKTKAFIEDWRSYETELIKPHYVKIFADGAADSHTLLMKEPYADDPGNTGSMYRPFEEYREAILDFHAKGVSVHVHAMGDGTIARIIDIFEEAEKTYPDSDALLHLGHAWWLDDEDLGRLAALEKVTVNFSPMLAVPHPQMELFITVPAGEERHQKVFPVRSTIGSGLSVGFGSDFPSSLVPDPEQFWYMEGWVTRQVPGEPELGIVNPDEAISVEQAIRGFTLGGAKALGGDYSNQFGSIEVGKSADMIVLDRNPLEIPASEIHETQVDRTTFRGAVIFDRAAAVADLDVVKIESTNPDLQNAVDAADLNLLVEDELPGGRSCLGHHHSVAPGARSAPGEVNEAFGSLASQGYRYARPARTVYWKSTDSTYWIQWTVKDDVAVLWAYDPGSREVVEVLQVNES